MNAFFSLLFFTICAPYFLLANDYEIKSPDARIKVSFNLHDNKPHYSISVDNKTPIQNAALGLVIENSFSGEFKVLNQQNHEIDETYEMLWWKNKYVINHGKEMVIQLEEISDQPKKLNIIFRAYNDGVAFRYEIPEQPNLQEYIIQEDLSEFAFTDDFLWWSANGERDNLGPLSLNIFRDPVFSPVVLQVADDLYIGIHEAAIYDFANFKLKRGSRRNSLQCDLQGSSKGVTGMKTSWRTLLIGKRPGDLIESDLLVNLNPPCRIKDTSWITAGLSMWDWRAWGYTAPDGFTYGLNTPSHKRFIDFAAKNNIRFLLMDADWYGPEFSEDSDPTKANSQIDIAENMRYAKEKGVGIILYLNDLGAQKFGLERILKQFHDWGAVGVKYGFMSASGQEKVLYTRQVIEMCATYKLMVNFHDNPIPPSGDERTWPNVLTREYCHSQADAMYSYYPETVVSSSFINMMAGPVDMCNGWYAFEGAEVRPKVFKFLPGTVVAENAKLVVVFSGITVLPDAPEAYNQKSDLFEFIQHLPAHFDEYRVLDGEIERFITVARRSGENWYLGSLTTREPRTLQLSMDFLKSGINYIAYLYEDAPDTHFLDNREAYQTRKLEVNSNSSITIFLAPGGGNCIRIERID